MLLCLHDILPSVFHGLVQSAHLPHLELLDLTDTCKHCSLLLQHVTYPPTVMLRIELSSYLENNITELSSQIASKLSDPCLSGASIRSLLFMNKSFSVVAAWRKQISGAEIISNNPKNADVELELDLPDSRYNRAILLEPFITPLPLLNVRTLGLASGATFRSSRKTFSCCMPNIQELGVSCANSEAAQKVLRLLAIKSIKPDSSPPPPPLFPHLRILLLSGMKFCNDTYDNALIMLRLLRKMLRSRKLSKRMIEELVLNNVIDLGEEDLDGIHGLVGKITRESDDVHWAGFTDSEDEEDSDDDDKDESDNESGDDQHTGSVSFLAA